MLKAFSQRGALNLLAALCVSLSLTGCSAINGLFGGDDHSVPSSAKCPGARAVPELSSLHEFTGTSESFNDLAYVAHITNLTTDCDLEFDKATVTISFRLDAERGPKSSGAHKFPFFVAVSDPDGKIISKRTVDAGFDFVQGQAREGSVQNVTETVSYGDPKDAEDYTVLIGLQLTPQERDYNLKTGD